MDSVVQHWNKHQQDKLQLKYNYTDSVTFTVLEQIIIRMQNIHSQEMIPDRKTGKKN